LESESIDISSFKCFNCKKYFWLSEHDEEIEKDINYITDPCDSTELEDGLEEPK